ncbi:hydrogenase maturation protease [Occallatibacter riparius]|uniref:Hydrogenase maturation protease n=1 Tax=Occallatibacter riparius TaxID=1002689 RepID=A0A9J7BRP9_9BACT|nr:hydrogenase maturation protease [Occallatibacter riparius]UWZ83598.1 hydrogenase maturation protease [Occallatibacter riparius]
MSTPWVRCLILACGNTLRGDDGIGPFLCSWAGERFAGEPGVQTIARQQWTPDLAQDIANAESVLFIDCAVDLGPGQLLLRQIKAAPPAAVSTHHSGAAELLRLAQDLYNATPRRACLLTIGAGSVDLGEEFSAPMQAAIPNAKGLLELTLRQLLRRPTV